MTLLFWFCRSVTFVIVLCTAIIYSMGNIPEGTLCSYCGVHEADYIPDGCCGPLCIGERWEFEDGKPSCDELGWGVAEYKRLFRFVASRFKVITKSIDRQNPLSDQMIMMEIARFVIRL